MNTLIEEEWTPSPPPEEEWTPSPPPEEEWTPSPPPEEEWTPSPPPEEEWTPTPPPEEEWAPSPPPEEEWTPSPPPEEEFTPTQESKNIFDRLPRAILQHVILPKLSNQAASQYAQTAQGDQKTISADLAKRKEALDAEKEVLTETYNGKKQAKQIETMIRMQSNPYFDWKRILKKHFLTMSLSSQAFKAKLTKEQWKQLLHAIESSGTIMENYLTSLLEYSSLKPQEKQEIFDEFAPKLWMQYDDLGKNSTGKLRLDEEKIFYRFLDVYRPYFYGKTWNAKKRQEIFSKWGKHKKVWNPSGEYEQMLTKYFGLDSRTTP